MSTVNAFLRHLFDVLQAPFAGLHPLVGISVWSLVVGVFALLVFKRTSNQDALAAVKRRIHAGLFEIRLFNDDLRAIFRAQLEILRHNVTYVRLSMIPLLWMIVPIFLILAQLQFHYGYAGLAPGSKTFLKVRIGPSWDESVRPPAELETPAGVRVDEGPLWIPAQRELMWRLGVDKPGAYELELNWDGTRFSKSLDATQGVTRRSPLRLAPDFLGELLYPAEAPLPADAPIESIELIYPSSDAGLPFGASELMWMLAFFVLSMVFALALRKPLGVTI